MARAKAEIGAKDVIGYTATEKVKGKSKPHTVKVSDEKKALFESIFTNLDRCEGVEPAGIHVLTENKLIEVKIGDKTFKIDLIECRKPKKQADLGRFPQEIALKIKKLDKNTIF